MFYHQELSKEPKYPMFSNFYKQSYTINGIHFKTSEHGFMYSKALLFEDSKMAEEILEAATPKDAKVLGRKVRGFDEDVWKKHRHKIMFMHCYQKFSHKKLKTILCGTGESTLVEASPRDKIWGIGYSKKDAFNVSIDKWGQNLLGKTLMKVRSAFMSNSSVKFDKYVKCYFI